MNWRLKPAIKNNRSAECMSISHFIINIGAFASQISDQKLGRCYFIQYAISNSTIMLYIISTNRGYLELSEHVFDTFKNIVQFWVVLVHRHNNKCDVTTIL